MSQPDGGAGYGPAGTGATSVGAAEGLSVHRVRTDLPNDRTAEGDSEVEASSFGALVGRLTGDLSRLMRAELALAKAEAKEEATAAGKGVGMLAGAGVAGQLVLVFGSLALMFGLGHWMAWGWAALVVAVLWAIVAGVLASSGRKNLSAAKPLPQTVDTLKEDAQWAKRPRG